MTLTSPKRPSFNSTAAKASWVNFYAGYSDSFVRDVFQRLSLRPGAILADPWNGSGTTTQIASEYGLECRGFDINPAMTIVARARLLGASIWPGHDRLAARICKLAMQVQGHIESEPLCDWFVPSSAAVLRALERAITRFLVSDEPILYTSTHLSDVSQLACFFYVALFRTTRSFLEPFACSNPTWIKIPTDPRSRVRPTRNEIISEFRLQVSRMGEAFRVAKASIEGNVTVHIGDSTALPLADESVDHVVTSPPYCTRIDYVAATRPELAALGIGHEGVSSLRRETIGSVLTMGQKSSVNAVWGRTCLRLLDTVRSHPSRASKSYYFNTHARYFDKLFRSIMEIERTLRPGGSVVMVVQDSFYKDIHNDLQAIVTEMAERTGLTYTEQMDFHLPATMAAINSRHKRYRKGHGATESVLWFKKCREITRWK